MNSTGSADLPEDDTSPVQSNSQCVSSAAAENNSGSNMKEGTDMSAIEDTELMLKQDATDSGSSFTELLKCNFCW